MIGQTDHYIDMLQYARSKLVRVAHDKENLVKLLKHVTPNADEYLNGVVGHE